jgi:hypothetical protein
MRFGLWLSFILLMTACADSGQKCGNKVLALWPDEGGDYSFQEVQLSTLNDPYTLSGGAAKVYYESLIGGSGFTGSVAHPRYTRSGDLCVPMDAASSMAVSVYAQFERIMQFESKIGTLDMLSWPRKVGLDIHVNSSDGMSHNNAHYFGQGDAIAVLPYNMKGLPLGLNPGVLAHEHFHGHFQRHVIAVTNAQLAPTFDPEALFYSAFNMVSAKPTVEDVDRGDLRTPRGLNAFVLRSWNEGLADVYGSIYSKNPHFFDASLPTLKEARALNAPLAMFMSAAIFQFNAERIMDPKSLVAISYDQGAYLARLMYSIAQSGVEPPEKFLVRIMRRLDDVPAAIVGDYDDRVLEFEEILPVLLKDFPLDAQNCASLRAAVSKELMKKSFASCSAQ